MAGRRVRFLEIPQYLTTLITIIINEVQNPETRQPKQSRT